MCCCYCCCCCLLLAWGGWNMMKWKMARRCFALKLLFSLIVNYCYDFFYCSCCYCCCDVLKYVLLLLLKLQLISWLFINFYTPHWCLITWLWCVVAGGNLWYSTQWSAVHTYVYTYIIGHYNPLVRIIDLASHTTYVRRLP